MTTTGGTGRSAGRITAVRCILLRLPLERPINGPFGRLDARPNLIAVVETDSGHRGIGEIWANFPPWGPHDRVAILRDAVAPLLVGETLDDPSRLYASMHRRLRLLANQWGAPGPVHQTVAGADIALWDAFARAQGRPLAAVLRADGRMPPRLPVYASGIRADAAGTIAGARGRGHRRFKLQTAFDRETNRRLLREGRAAAGDDPLMTDANQTFDAESFAALRDDLVAARLLWVEEPFPVDDIAAYRGWPRELGLPLAFGENARGLAELEQVIALGADVVQPDITKTAGISEGLAIGRRVVAAGRKLCLHMYGGGLGVIASAHLTAAVDGAHWLETDANANPLYDEVFTPAIRIEDGDLVMPEGPGLGVTLRDDTVRRFGVAT
ncbi:MAG: mandelate racemase/muconate lactonizing enzyme family protein [Alphaproteobacteria bacterium]|nr:mandelate racemase/muconate lactonizing enzyme family protein [Alphaproteobacteria bacterium]